MRHSLLARSDARDQLQRASHRPEVDTTYHYRVISTDAAGNVTVSADRTFKTKT